MREANVSVNVASPDLSVPDATNVVTEPQPDAQSRVLARLLKMADAYRDVLALRHAMAIYFLLADQHGDTPQGEEARERLLEIAETHERAGEHHQARSIYERLL